MKYICTICGYTYDEAKEGRAFKDLPDSWVCPVCGAAKSAFKTDENSKPLSGAKASGAVTEAGSDLDADKKNTDTAFSGTVAHAGNGTEEVFDEDMKRLSSGELAALCSNLARGCEKQYMAREAALFKEIADYFSTTAPAVPETDIEHLAALFKKDLESGYPELFNEADSALDRGTKRICVWGEKVTNIQSTLLARWEREGDAFLKNAEVWVCSVCGFIYVGNTPPEICPVCKVPSWKFDKIERRYPA